MTPFDLSPNPGTVDHDLGDNCFFRQTPNGFGPVRTPGRDRYDMAQRTAKRLARARWQRPHAMETYAKHLQNVANDVYRGHDWPNLDEQARHDVGEVLSDMHKDDAFRANLEARRLEIIASLTAQPIAAD